MFFQSVMYEMSNFVSCLHGRKKLEEIQIVSLLACSFYYRSIANLRKRILHQMKTSLSPPDQLCSLRKPRGCCVTHSFTFSSTTHCLQNAIEESYRNKAIQIRAG